MDIVIPSSSYPKRKDFGTAQRRISAIKLPGFRYARLERFGWSLACRVRQVVP
jgi:hypothetical protein